MTTEQTPTPTEGGSYVLDASGKRVPEAEWLAAQAVPTAPTKPAATEPPPTRPADKE